MNNIVEKEIISCILQKPDKLMTVAVSQIKPDDFQEPLHKHIYEVMYQLFLEGKPIDVVSLIQNGLKDYSQTLLDLQNFALITTNFKNHLKVLRELSRKAQAKTMSVELQALLENEGIENCREKAAELLQVLGAQQSAIQATAAEGIDGFIERTNKKPDYFSTGFDLINRYAFIQRGDFVIVGGRPSSGKTAITLQIAAHIALSRKVIYFSCETSKDKIYERVISHYYDISMDNIKRRQIDTETQKLLKESKQVFSAMKLVVVQASGWTVAEVKAKAIEEQADIIFIDYLTLLSAKGKSFVEITTNISRGLHIMAQQTGITVVALSQLNRQGEGEPSNTALRESGQIEQDADIIFMIWPTDDGTNMTHKVKITKNKEGELRTFGLNFDGKTQTFKALTNRDF